MNIDALTIRLATVEDVPALVHHRRAMFEDIGHTDRAALDAMDAAFGPWVYDRIQRGEYLAWLVVDQDDTVIAGADLWVMAWPPGPIDTSAHCGFVYNVYTRPDYRKHGLARQLMITIIDWCRQNGISMVGLHASDAGRPLYASLGFEQTNEMRLMLGNGAG